MGFMGLPWRLSRKESACKAGDAGGGFDPWVGKMPWRRAWKPTPVLLPGECHGQRSLVGCSPWGLKELDTTERLSTAHIVKLVILNSASLIPLIIFFIFPPHLIS